MSRTSITCAALVAAWLFPCAAEAGPTVAACNVFPADNIWNARVDWLPVLDNSAELVAAIGAGEPLRPDFGSGLYEGAPIGIPYAVVPFRSTRKEIVFEARDGEGPYPDESDHGPAPIPDNAAIEGGPSSAEDRHVIVVEEGSCTLFELYKAHPNGDGSWSAAASVRFDLESDELRIDGYTSADAAGLPIFPGLVRWEEIAAGEIAHALRFTAPRTRAHHVWPARHSASGDDDPGLPAMGQRFRLKADFDISGYSQTNQVILTALKTYGMMLADNGSPWFLSGSPHDAWDNDDLAQLRNLTGADFEAVDVSSLMVDADSGATGAPERAQEGVPAEGGDPLQGGTDPSATPTR